MKEVVKKGPILITGNSKLSFSTAVCMLQSGYSVILFTPAISFAEQCMLQHAEALANAGAKKIDLAEINIITSLDTIPLCELAIAITDEKLADKKMIIKQLESNLPSTTLIGINSESIELEQIQKDAKAAERIIGLNWVEPAHTTFFLEIIANKNNNRQQIEGLAKEAKAHWNKDPYVVYDSISVRARLFCAMAREAFYLIENGFATVQDIDRACRNDAGYYLPFAGNFRYMDLMGTHSYAEVMKKLNSDLATDSHPPKILKEIIDHGGLGMENNKGFYSYQNGDTADWEKLFTNFSFKIQEIIEKYPFNYDEKQPITDN